MMIILCQWDFSERIEKLVSLLLYTSENCSSKVNARGTFCTQSVNEGLIYNRATVCSLLIAFLNSALVDMFLNLVDSYNFIMVSE